MRTIASLKGPEFLRAINHLRHAVSDFLATTGVHELRKMMPAIPEGISKEEEALLYDEQAKRNLNAILDRLLEENPEATYKILTQIVIPDEGEELDGFDLIDAGLEILNSKKVMDFFIKLARSAQETTED